MPGAIYSDNAEHNSRNQEKPI